MFFRLLETWVFPKSVDLSLLCGYYSLAIWRMSLQLVYSRDGVAVVLQILGTPLDRMVNGQGWLVQQHLEVHMLFKPF